MAKINADLLAKIRARSGLSQSAAYRQISERSHDANVSAHVASLMIAKDLGLGYQRYATEADRAEMRGSPVIKHQFLNAREVRAAKMPTRASAPVKPVKPTKNNSLFVVHGRDTKLTEDMFALLRALGLNPLEWSQAVQNVPGANPNIGKIVHTALKKVQGVIVMFSPDEQAKLKSKFASPKDKRDRLHRLEGQARPNVIFEAGIALGAYADKTLLIEIGEVRKISDIDGMHILHLNNSATSRKELAQRLRKLTFKVDTSGTSWLTIGNFHR